MWHFQGTLICCSWIKVAGDENKKVAWGQIVKNLDYQAKELNFSW